LEEEEEASTIVGRGKHESRKRQARGKQGGGRGKQGRKERQVRE
jgi:hypothetical protein